MTDIPPSFGVQPNMPPVTTRFAPSPTGLLHLGSAYSALFAEQAARKAGGRFLLRIEDIDRGRCRPEFEDAIYRDLEWLGIEWDGPVRRQSEHFDLYDHFLHSLEEGGLIYPCFCTRKEIAASASAPHGPDGPLYPGTCKTLSRAETAEREAAGQSPAMRLHMDRAARMIGPLAFTDRERGIVPVDPVACGDVVLGRKEVPTSYHLSVTVDDGLQHISLVTRGADLLETTAIHRILQSLLGLPEPAYHHHRVLTDADGERLSKRQRSLTIAALREAGKTPAEVRALVGFSGQTPS
ncbi:MAG: tRNA glutamyl-Q(34) synthetase GluQRS [Alphaproteobacteria bacterium]